MPAPGKVASVSSKYLVCALLVLACAPVLVAKDSLTSSPTPIEITAPYTAPLELIHDKPYVSVMVNSRGPFRFLIDTGTGGQALISPELADELALPTVGHARLKDPSGKGEQRSDIVEIRSVRLAGVDFAGIKAIRHRLY